MAKTDKRKLGDLGEEIACNFLIKHGFKIIERNYLKKWGEIDIIAEKAGIVHFVEVKTVSSDLSVIRETNDSYRAKENIHPWKLQRLSRAIESYLLEFEREGDWHMDAVIVLLDSKNKKAQANYIENINL